jgi:hypothetical protein
MIESKSPPLYLIILSLIGFFVVASIILYQAQKNRKTKNESLYARSMFDNTLNSLIQAKDSLQLANFLAKIPKEWQDEQLKESLLMGGIIHNSIAILQLGKKYGVNLQTPFKSRNQIRNSLNVFYSTGNWLHFAAIRKSTPEVMAYLISEGLSKTQKVTCVRSSDADAEISNNQGCPYLDKTPLEIALAVQADSTVIQLLR